VNGRIWLNTIANSYLKYIFSKAKKGQSENISNIEKEIKVNTSSHSNLI